MTENEVVDCIERWLRDRGFTIQGTCKNTARGDDVAATARDGARLFVECKGSISRQSNPLDSWHNAAMAIFGAIKDTEELRPEHRHAIAVPDTEQYRRTIGRLDNFFVRQGISVLWVQGDGTVLHEGAPNNALQATCEDARA